MAAASDYLEQKLLDLLFGNTSYTIPATLYVALFTSAPTAAGGGTEVSGGSYARAAVTNNTTNWSNFSGGFKQNATAIAFAQATASWGTVTHWAIFDALSGGNLIAFGALTNSRTVASGETPSFPVNTLKFTLS